jgi:hypothetical protein
MLYVRDGVFFELGGDGSVILHIRNDDSENAHVAKVVSIPRDQWKEVLKETAFTEFLPATEAPRLHLVEPKVPDEPLAEEPKILI